MSPQEQKCSMYPAVPVADLWFDDGNLILQADQSVFRIYSGILAARSSVFKDMLAFPPPLEGNAMMDGCPIVQIYDSPTDMTYFLRAILDSSYFEPPPTHTELPIIAGILRLATKYDVQYLRKRALHHLLTTFPMTHEDWKDRDAKRTIPPVDNTPFAALCLAREFDLPWILPSVLYCITSHPLLKTLDGAPWCDSNLDLPWEDKRMCMIGRSNLLMMQSKGALELMKTPTSLEDECVGESCRSTRLRCAEVMTGWGVAGFLDFYEENSVMFVNEFCSTCLASFKEECATASQSMWAALPSVFELPDWDKLETLFRATVE